MLCIGIKLSEALSEEENYGEKFETKVSSLIKKLMNSKYVNNTPKLHKKLARIDRTLSDPIIEPESDNVTEKEIVSTTESSTTSTTTTTTATTSSTTTSTTTTTTTTTTSVHPVFNEVLLTKINKENTDHIESSTKYPLWDPINSKGKPKTRPPYIISFTPYTTPTPLPNRPEWNKDDWLNYFKGNHPNFWFQKHLQEQIKTKFNDTVQEAFRQEAMKEENELKENGEEESQFDYENWKSWSPEEWIRWSNSKEYKEKYLNVLNPYR